MRPAGRSRSVGSKGDKWLPPVPPLLNAPYRTLTVRAQWPGLLLGPLAAMGFDLACDRARPEEHLYPVRVPPLVRRACGFVRTSPGGDALAFGSQLGSHPPKRTHTSKSALMPQVQKDRDPCGSRSRRCCADPLTYGAFVVMSWVIVAVNLMVSPTLSFDSKFSSLVLVPVTMNVSVA